MHRLIDFVTKKTVHPSDWVFCGDDNTPWEVVMDMAVIAQKINRDYFKSEPPALSKYLPFMPIQHPSEFVSLQETATPLLKSKVLGDRLGFNLYFKVEGKNPTGSFKDRGSAVDISVARELGAQGIILASTGNMAASCACYAAVANIPCFVLVPEGVSASKLAQVIAFGGHIVQVKGHYNDAARLAKTIAQRMGFYLAGDYAYRVEGQKTAAFELADQLAFQMPDLVVVPMGCGTNIAAYAKGFEEYHQLGFIDKIPRLLGVQAVNADAIVRSYRDGIRVIHPQDSANTVASAIAVPNPIDGIKALDALYKTQGLAVAVTDQAMLEAQYLLSTQEGLFVETACAATLAALMTLPDKEAFQNGRVVCVLTGDGLKETQVVLKAAIKPPTIAPDENEFYRLYDSHFFNANNVIFTNKERVVFDVVPSREALKSELRTLVNADYSENYLDKIHEKLSLFLQKGKVITVSDLQDLVQTALETPRAEEGGLLRVLDFNVTTGKNRAAQASVTVQIASQRYEASAGGVGPVDAVIKALCEACEPHVHFNLTEYKVDIRHHGEDAVVYVDLRLMKGEHASQGRSSSPDVVQASIEAFEAAYNGFPK